MFWLFCTAMPWRLIAHMNECSLRFAINHNNDLSLNAAERWVIGSVWGRHKSITKCPTLNCIGSPWHVNHQQKNMFVTNIIRTLEEDVWFLKGIMNDWDHVFYLSNQTFRSRGSSLIKHFYSSPVNTEGSVLYYLRSFDRQLRWYPPPTHTHTHTHSHSNAHFEIRRWNEFVLDLFVDQC